ncbi:MAG: type II toxin-antitoxin system VapC family toxin [Candidatus Aminicenantes bacterium]|nr:type II toxin-antitoxin system VapC family toxin [Candidatus Aminicenantes bacterium]
MKKFLLDTSAYARFLAGDQKVLDRLAKANRVYMSIFVLGELLAGFRAGAKERHNRRILERFLSKPSVSVLEATTETAEYFGMIKAVLRHAGRPIPINDVWIAAHALDAGAVLVTYDFHFQAVPGLRIWEEIGEPAP